MKANAQRIIDAFQRYMNAEGNKVSRGMFEKNLQAKVSLRQFADDLRPLLSPSVLYDAKEAARIISEELLSRL